MLAMGDRFLRWGGGGKDLFLGLEKSIDDRGAGITHFIEAFPEQSRLVLAVCPVS